MASPVIQFKRGVIANLPALRAGEPGFTTDSYDLYVGIDSTTNNNKYLGSARYWTKETASSATVLKLLEASGNGTSNIGLRAPASVGSDLTYTLPGTATDGYFLKTDATGTLSWTGTIVAAGDDHDLAGTTDLDEVSVSGFSTFSKNVDVAGITSTQDLYVAGISTFVGACTFKGGTVTLGDATTDNVVFTSDVNSNIIPNTDGAYDLGSSSQQWRDLFINGTVDADSLVVSGVSTLGGFVDINDSVNISDGLEVTGFSTFTKFVDINESADISGGLNVSGIVTASSFVGDGANLTGIDATAIQTGTTKVQTSAPGISNEVGGLGIGTFSGAGLNVTGVVTATSFTATESVDIAGGVSVTGISTFSSNVDINSDVDINRSLAVTGGATVTGLSTFTGNVDVNSDVDINRSLAVTGGTTISGLSTFTGNVDVNSDVDINRSLAVTGGATVSGFSTFTKFVDINESADISGGLNVTGVVTATSFDGNLATTNLTGTITNAQLTGSITNAKLVNDSVSYGGVSVDLGASDATPAFDLTDATNYPTSSLSGTITNSQLAGSIADAKLASTFLKNTVEDTTPQLGGDLDLNSKNITGTGNINLTGIVTATTFIGALTGNVTGNASGSSGSCTGNSSTATTATTATNVTVADESSDTSCNVLFTTAATGNLAPKSGTNLTFNSSSGVLTATGFAGDLTGAVTGNADTATTATNVTVADESSDTSCNVLFTTAATGNLAPKSGTNLTFNSSSGVLTATGFAGPLTGAVTGNADTSTTATNANHINVADNEATNENNLIPFIEDASATGNVGLESDGDFHYNPSTGTVTATIVVTGAGTLGSNGNGTRTVSTSDPSSGANGDVWFKYEA